MDNIINDFLNAFKKSNNGLMQLIFINIAVFVVLSILELFGSAETLSFLNLPYHYLRLPKSWLDAAYQPWSVLTYSFLHAGIMHLLFNMLALYWFGRIIDDLIGSNRLIGIYVWGAIAGGLLYLIMYNTVPYYMNSHVSAVVGASGSVLAIVVAAATLAPDYRFNLVFLGPVKIIWIAAVYVLMSVLGLKGTNAGGEIVHLGGAFMGWLFITQLRKGVEFTKPITYVMDFTKALFSSSSKLKVSHRKSGKKTTRSTSPSSSSSNTSNVPQHEIDAILDKISASGYESLSKEEKRKLFSASQKNQS